MADIHIQKYSRNLAVCDEGSNDTMDQQQRASLRWQRSLRDVTISPSSRLKEKRCTRLL